MALHFTREEFAERRRRALEAMAAHGLDALLLFKQESMYWLTGYDTFGYCFFQCLVVRADGRPAGMGEIAVRTILRVIDNYLVGMIVMIATGERRQRIGDLAAGTIVVDASGPAVMAPPAPVVDVFQPVDHEDEVDDEPEAEEPEAQSEPEPEIELEEQPLATQTPTDRCHVLSLVLRQSAIRERGFRTCEHP